MTLEELINARNELLWQRSTGVRSAGYSAGNVSRNVEYRTDRELMSTLSDLERRIAEMQSRPAPTTIRFATSKGC